MSEEFSAVSHWFRSMHPKRWHLLTWAFFLLWLSAGLLANYPHDVPDEVLGGSLEYGNALYRVSVLTGWPFVYRTQNVALPSMRRTTTYHPFKAGLNAALIASSVTCGVYVCQKLKRFSIRIMMLLVAASAVVMVIAKGVISSGSYYAVLAFASVIYFSPVVFAAGIALRGRADRRGNFENKQPTSCH